MKKNYSYAFAFGFVCGLKEKLIDFKKIKYIEKCKTLEELKDSLKNIKYEVSSFKNFEDFSNNLDIYYNEKVKELKNISPEKDKFFYVFCKNDFLNFKIILKSYFIENIQQIAIKPNSIPLDIIKKSLKTKNFEEIKAPFKEIFIKNFERMKKLENIRIVEILIDKDMYELMLKLCGTDYFLQKITKTEITIKNINFCLRYIKYCYDINELENYIIDGSYIEKEDYIKASKKGQESLYSLLEKIDIKNYYNNLQETLNKKLEEIYKDNILDCFCFTPIYIYIKTLEKEIKFLKKIAVNIIFNKNEKSEK